MRRIAALTALGVMVLVSSGVALPARAEDPTPAPSVTQTPSGIEPSPTPAPSPSASPGEPSTDPTPAPSPPPVPPPKPPPKPAPKPAPQPASVTNLPPGIDVRGDLIEISIGKQTLTAWRDGRVVMRFAISTGRPGYRTVRGRFRVISKSVNAYSRKWKVIMPWAMNWHGNYFIHQLPHYPGSKRLIGRSQLGKPASHGCVRVGVPDAERLYRWAHVGTPVWVH